MDHEGLSPTGRGRTGGAAARGNRRITWRCPCDACTVEIELPGVKKDDLDVEVAGRRLSVSGERKERERVGILRRRERMVGRFRYEVVLPGEVDEDGVAAHLDEGVLTVGVPKPASERPRRIAVR